MDTRERKISASSRHFINFSDRALFHACHNKIKRGSVGPFNRKFQITELPYVTLKERYTIDSSAKFHLKKAKDSKRRLQYEIRYLPVM